MYKIDRSEGIVRVDDGGGQTVYSVYIASIRVCERTAGIETVIYGDKMNDRQLVEALLSAGL